MIRTAYTILTRDILMIENEQIIETSKAHS